MDKEDELAQVQEKLGIQELELSHRQQKKKNSSNNMTTLRRHISWK